MELLVRSLPPSLEQKHVVLSGSELANRLQTASVVRVHRLGLLAPLAVFSLLKIVRSWRPDLLHAHTSKALETALMIKALTGLPVVTSKRNAYPVRGSWKYKRADGVIAVSDAARYRLLEAGVEDPRIRVIHDAVDEARFDVSCNFRRAEMPVVFCAAALSPEKGLDTLLDAWKIIEAEGLSARLLIAGTGSQEVQLHARRAELGLRQLQFLGWREDVPDLVSQADIAVLPSREEGLSSFLCEAQWAGKAAVATHAGGIPEVVLDGETGLLSPPDDAGALADNLSRLLRNEPLRQKMGKAAALRARTLFRPETIASQHRKVYHAVAR